MVLKEFSQLGFSFLLDVLFAHLFLQDKLVFSFLVCVNLQRSENKIVDSEWLFLLTGGVALATDPMPNPAPEWLPETTWVQVQWLSCLPSLKVGYCSTLTLFTSIVVSNYVYTLAILYLPKEPKSPLYMKTKGKKST